MIIFDLESLADDSHRRHFIDPEENYNFARWNGNDFRGFKNGQFQLDVKWKTDWKSYHAAIGDDKPIPAMESIYEFVAYATLNSPSIQIWSNQYEPGRETILDWIIKNYYWNSGNREYLNQTLKLRPAGDERPAELLFETWLKGYMAYPKLSEMQEGVEYRRNDLPQMVFSANPDVIAMFRRHNIFVFDCNQAKEI